MAAAGGRPPADPSALARRGSTDAVRAGLVRGSSERARRVSRGGPRDAGLARERAAGGRSRARRGRPGAEGGRGSRQGAPAAGEAARRSRVQALARGSARAEAALAPFRAAYDGLDGDGGARDGSPAAAAARSAAPARAARARRATARGPSPRGSSTGAPGGSLPRRRGRAGAGPARGTGRGRRPSGAGARRHGGRAARRAAQARARGAAAAAGRSAARRGAAAKLVAAVAPGALPAGACVAAALSFVVCVLAVAQLVSALFGFWSHEESAARASGLPPYVTREMVVTALECQEEYGHPAGCTIAQIICESGVGDSLSGLAERDRNLFGIKWADSFAGCPEVEGWSSWQTGEELGGQDVQVQARFTVFSSHRDCIVFRSRVLLQAERYAGNALIRRAIEECDSDLMAEGLKDAGYATDSSYVEALKSAMDAYGLRRFDGMTVEEYESGEAAMAAVLEAARSQLGVPYVWGGSTPGEALDCSGLTQWCYSQAGIAIPRTANEQHEGGEEVPLSEARPGDILWRDGHVAIYVGGDSYIHAPKPGDVVREATGVSYFTCAVRYR